MKFTTGIGVVLSLVFPLGFARAQSGTLDQVSPPSNAGYNGDAVSLTWQQQVTAGLAGQLEGVKLELSGAIGATLAVRVRMGPGWNTTPTVFQGAAVKSTSTSESVFVNMTSANILVAPGTQLVIEMQGTATGCGMSGSHVDPPGAPLYPDPLYLNGPPCYVDCGYRIAFRTYVLNSVGTVYCSGDGSATACPCGNSGAPGNGCASSVDAAGAHLGASGNFSIANDSGTISGTGMPNATCLYFQGTTQTNGGTGTVFGDGLRCASGTIIRLGTKTNVAGASQYPNPGDQSISVRGLVTSPGMRAYQVWYRNAATFCTPSTFNLSNGLAVNWQS